MAHSPPPPPVADAWDPAAAEVGCQGLSDIRRMGPGHCGHEGVEGGDVVIREAVVDMGAVTSGADEVGELQDLEVRGDGGDPHACLTGQGIHGALTLGEEVEEFEALRERRPCRPRRAGRRIRRARRRVARGGRGGLRVGGMGSLVLDRGATWDREIGCSTNPRITRTARRGRTVNGWSEFRRVAIHRNENTPKRPCIWFRRTPRGYHPHMATARDTTSQGNRLGVPVAMGGGRKSAGRGWPGESDGLTPRCVPPTSSAATLTAISAGVWLPIGMPNRRMQP
jgi:hypothetical protein